MNDTRARLPESDSVSFTGRSEEIVNLKFWRIDKKQFNRYFRLNEKKIIYYLGVDVVGDLKIGNGSIFGSNQVISMDSRGDLVLDLNFFRVKFHGLKNQDWKKLMVENFKVKHFLGLKIYLELSQGPKTYNFVWGIN